MATSKPDDFEDPASARKSYEAPRRPRGCFFYGCLISSGLGLLLLIAVGIFSYMAYRSLVRFVEENTATAPRELPRVELPAADHQSLDQRVESFKKANDAGEPTEPLVLTADEVNALIEADPHWKGQVYLSIDGDKVRSQLSVSLDRVSERLEKRGIAMLRGRYFNGEVELKASLDNGILNVEVESLAVNGRLVPKGVVDALKDTTIEFSKAPPYSDEIRKIESLEVKDGKIIIKGRVKKKERAAGASTSQPILPDDVFAPP